MNTEEFTPELREVAIEISGRCFFESSEVRDFVGRYRFSQKIRASLDQKKMPGAVIALWDACVRYNEMSTLMSSLTSEFPNRNDIRLLVLTLRSLLSKDQMRTQCSDEFSNYGNSEGDLERLTSDGSPFLSMSKAIDRLSEAKQRVCLIRQKSNGQELGTGFLTGESQILTCFHVIETTSLTYHGRDLLATDLEVAFDYFEDSISKSALDWISVDPEKPCPFSRYSPADIATPRGLPNEDDLDFAILTIQKPVGRKIERGHYTLSESPNLITPASPILIAQHPGDPPPPARPERLLPLKLAFATPGFEGMNANRTRVIYKPSTLKGSSGSPVFDGNLDLVALHHNGGASVEGDINKQNNRGIPIYRIANVLQ